MATRRRMRMFSPSYTAPIPPVPMRRVMRYLPSMTWPVSSMPIIERIRFDAPNKTASQRQDSTALDGALDAHAGRDGGRCALQWPSNADEPAACATELPTAAGSSGSLRFSWDPFAPRLPRG